MVSRIGSSKVAVDIMWLLLLLRLYPLCTVYGREYGSPVYHFEAFIR